MGNITRAFVIALTITGALATASTPYNSDNSSVITKLSSIPIPVCPPNDPNACGIVRK
jgi:hypothetical protein